MNNDLQRVIALEKADQEVARLNEEVAALPKRVAAIETKLAQIKGEIEKAQNTIKANEQARRKLESDIQAQQAKISKYREQMLNVKTNDEYRALQHEIEFAEKEIRGAEDKILNMMVDTESQEAKLKETQAEMKRQAAEVEREKEQARLRTAEDEKLLAEWAGKRAELRSGVDEAVLVIYDRVLKQRKSVTAQARDHMCTACRVMLRPQKYSEVRTNQQVMTCDSCGRILVYVPAAEPAKSESAPAQ